MKMQYEALLLDIDGTLLDEHGVLTAPTLEAIKGATSNGVKVFLTTGRSVPGTTFIHRQLDLTTPCICFNGLIIFNPDNDEWIRVSELPQEALPSIKKWAHDLTTFFFVTTRDTYHTVTVQSQEQHRIMELVGSVQQLPTFDSLPKEGVVKVQCFCSDKQRIELCSFIENSSWSSSVHTRFFPLETLPELSDFPLVYVDLEPMSKGKAEALAFLEEEYDIPFEKVVAVGDQVNDIPMVEAAGLGVAMGNGHESLKNCADLIIGGNYDDGLATFIDGLLHG